MGGAGMSGIAAIFMQDGWKKLTFGVMVQVMGWHLTYTRHMSGEAFAGLSVGVMGFVAGGLVADKFIKGRDERLTTAPLNDQPKT
jgi:hypothetical protein